MVYFFLKKNQLIQKICSDPQKTIMHYFPKALPLRIFAFNITHGLFITYT